MLQQFRSVRSFLSARKVLLEGPVSLSIHRVTAAVVFAFCLLVSSLQYFGDPIQCVQDRKDEDAAINERVMNSFCFISSTYTVSEDRLGFECPGSFASPGVGPESVHGRVTRHSYYVWIPFVLLLQALSFLVPQSFWTYCDGGIVGKLIGGISGSTETKSDDVHRVSEYFWKRLGTHWSFALAWVLSDVLGFAIILANFFLTDLLLGNRFLNYGLQVASFLSAELGGCPNPFDEVFPKVTKCSFYKFGAGGSLQNFDSMCILPLNVVNEKIYTILWFWFLILTPLSFIWFSLKIGTVVCLNCLSANTLGKLFKRPWVQHMVGVPAVLPETSLPELVVDFTPSDWIFFSHVIAPMTPTTYKEFEDGLGGRLEKYSHPNPIQV